MTSTIRRVLLALLIAVGAIVPAVTTSSPVSAASISNDYSNLTCNSPVINGYNTKYLGDRVCLDFSASGDVAQLYFYNQANWTYRESYATVQTSMRCNDPNAWCNNVSAANSAWYSDTSEFGIFDGQVKALPYPVRFTTNMGLCDVAALGYMSIVDVCVSPQVYGTLEAYANDPTVEFVWIN
jgi:hypothetical protein